MFLAIIESILKQLEIFIFLCIFTSEDLNKRHFIFNFFLLKEQNFDYIKYNL